jgi:putative membrane protein
MQMRQNMLAGLAAVALITGCAHAQSSQSANRTATADRFMTSAAEGGMAEVEMGRIAVQNASDEKVKQFGQRMVDDHTKANDELKEIAARKNVTLPDGPNASQKATRDRLSKLHGAAFDRAYMQDMVKDHKEDVAEFQRASNRETDPDVKAFASKTLPTLQDHLKMAQETEGGLKK